MLFNVAEGKAVKCTSNPPANYPGPDAVMRYNKGTVRHYTNPTVASSWDPNWGTPQSIDCYGMTVGTDMPMNPNIADGQAVACSTNAPAGYPAGAVCRYSSAMVQWYPNPPIASSWDPNWGTSWVGIDCTSFQMGSSVIFNVAEGQAVNCNTNGPAGQPTGVYRFSQGFLRYYPTPAIASSWDPNWASPQNIDCYGMTRGLDMS